MCTHTHRGKVGQVRNSPFFADLQKRQSRVYAVYDGGLEWQRAQTEDQTNEPNRSVRLRASYAYGQHHELNGSAYGRTTMASLLFGFFRCLEPKIYFLFRFPSGLSTACYPPPANDHPIKRRSLVIKQCLINIRRF